MRQQGSTEVVRDLISNLHLEVAAFEELRIVLEEERTALVELDVAAINRCTDAKERIAASHRDLEGSRLVLAGRFEELHPGLNGASRLSEVADAAQAAGLDPDGALQRLRTRLVGLATAVAEMNRLNERFVAHSLVVVQGAMSMVRRAAGRLGPDAPPTYAATGRMSADEGARRQGRLELAG